MPPVTPAVQVTVCPTKAMVGDGEQEIVIGLPEMIKLKFVVLESGEPVIVIGWVPTGALEVTVNVTVEEQVGLHGLALTE